MNDTALIILAAGKASRFGDIKQLAEYNGKSLLQHVIDEGLAAQLHPLVVITGSSAESVAAAISQQSVQIVYNEHWQQGMASGIVAGVSFILSLTRPINSVIIAVCDQPFVSSDLFTLLIKKSKAGCQIVTSAYSETMGTPVLFNKDYFDELLQLKGEEGAKKIVKKHSKDVAVVDFPQGAVDIDTPEDYQRLKERQRHVL